VQHAADFSFVTPANPITAGETIIIYGTGFGWVYPAVPTGTAATGPAVLSGNGNGTPMSITIGQSVCTVLYAGIAPGSVGVYQINCQVGQDVQSGEQDLQVTFDALDLIAFFDPLSATQSNIVTVPVK
jgi:uncharacterized protein (TIGR03437 family)